MVIHVHEQLLLAVPEEGDPISNPINGKALMDSTVTEH